VVALLSLPLVAVRVDVTPVKTVITAALAEALEVAKVKLVLEEQ
jgi:hypothetical protein